MWVRVVPPFIRADSGKNLIKQGWGCQRAIKWLAAQLAEYSHDEREALDSSLGRATIFPPYDPLC